MTKSELIDAVQTRAEQDKGIELSKKDLGDIIETMFDVVSLSIHHDGRFSFPDFGTFTRTHRKQRPGRNPMTGKALVIKASNSVKFKPAPALKRLVQ